MGGCLSREGNVTGTVSQSLCIHGSPRSRDSHSKYSIELHLTCTSCDLITRRVSSEIRLCISSKCCVLYQTSKL